MTTLLVACSISLLVATAIWAVSRWRRSGELIAVHRLVEQLSNMEIGVARSKVEQLMQQGVVRYEPDATIEQVHAPCGSVLEGRSLVGENFEFFSPRESISLGGTKYFLIGRSGEETRFLAKENCNQVYVLDIEDDDVDPEIVFASIWHAALFELQEPEPN